MYWEARDTADHKECWGRHKELTFTCGSASCCLRHALTWELVPVQGHCRPLGQTKGMLRTISWNTLAKFSANRALFIMYVLCSLILSWWHFRFPRNSISVDPVFKSLNCLGITLSSVPIYPSEYPVLQGRAGGSQCCVHCLWHGCAPFPGGLGPSGSVFCVLILALVHRRRDCAFYRATFLNFWIIPSWSILMVLIKWKPFWLLFYLVPRVLCPTDHLHNSLWVRSLSWHSLA